MTACCKPIAAFVQSSLVIAMLRFCLTWSALVFIGDACRAEDPIEPPDGVEAATASDQVSDGPLLGSAEANTPARLDDAATSASQPLTPRPLFCCRPTHSAKPDVGADRQVHPTLAALADAVRPRRTTKPSAPRPSAMSLPSVRTPDSFETQDSPVERCSEPEPLRHESLETHEQIATPASETAQPQATEPRMAEPRATELETPKPEQPVETRRAAAKAAPRVIANPWAQRSAAKAPIEPISLPATPAAQTPRPVVEKKQTVERPTAPPALSPAEQQIEQHAWRSSEPRSVRLARFHGSEPGQTAGASPAPVANRAAAPRQVEDSAAENPLREGEAVRVSPGGAWSNASANPLR